MTCIPVINRADGLDDTEVAFWVDAWDRQANEIAAAFGVRYLPVIFFRTTDGLPRDCWGLTIKNEISVPGARGFHDDELGSIFSEIMVSGTTPVTGSHEIGEMTRDPMVNLWAPFDADHEQAIEISDRVEGDPTYTQDATVDGETRPVPVSNYLLPSAFDPNGKYPFDRLGVLKTWNEVAPGGYVIVRDITSGKVGQVFADAKHDDGISVRAARPPRHPRVIAGPEAGRVLAERLGRSGSRLLRRLRGF